MNPKAPEILGPALPTTVAIALPSCVKTEKDRQEIEAFVAEIIKSARLAWEKEKQ